MKTKSIKSTSSLITRRSALGLVLAGVTVPVLPALAAKDVFILVKPHIGPPIVLATCSGEIITALFESDMLIGSGGAARGFMRFKVGAEVVEYVAGRGGLDLDRAGEPTRAWVLAHRRGSSGKDARDYLLGSVAPAPPISEDCLIYTTVGPDVHVEPVRFEVPWGWEVSR